MTYPSEHRNLSHVALTLRTALEDAEHKEATFIFICGLLSYIASRNGVSASVQLSGIPTVMRALLLSPIDDSEPTDDAMRDSADMLKSVTLGDLLPKGYEVDKGMRLLLQSVAEINQALEDVSNAAS